MNDLTDQLKRKRVPTGLAIVAAFLAGVLITALVVPDRSVVRTAAGSTEAGDALGSAAAGSTGSEGSAGPGAVSGAGSDASAGGDAGAGTGEDVGNTGTPTGPAGPAGDASRGVDSGDVVIGFGIPDLSVIGALGPGYDQGDPVQHITGILKELRAEKRLPVNGRDIKPIYSSYNILSADEQRATCEEFGNDKRVFAVIAVHDFGPGNECTAREYHLPTFTSDGSSDAIYRRSAPNLFTMQMSADRMFRNYVAWAARAGFLSGKRIGVYFPSDPATGDVVRNSIIKPLKARHFDVVEEVQTGEPSTGGPTDSVAVQRFRSGRVNVAILIVSAVAKTNFFNQAKAQGYKPLYLENDAGFSTTDTATSTYPPDQFDGTPAFTGMRFGENNSGLPESAPAKWCINAIAKQTGNRIPRHGRDAEYIAANQACDEIMTVLHGLEMAGRDLTRTRFIAGVETIRDMTAGIHGNLTFTPQRHDGVSTWRPIRWFKSCTCWRVDGKLQPLLVK